MQKINKPTRYPFHFLLAPNYQSPVDGKHHNGKVMSREYLKVRGNLNRGTTLHVDGAHFNAAVAYDRR